jgi:hypothetical protein
MLQRHGTNIGKYVMPSYGLSDGLSFHSGVSNMMMLPVYFWDNTNFCPEFPIPKVDWLDITFKPIPGVRLPGTPKDGSEII